MVDPSLESSPLAPEKLDRPRAMLTASGLLVASAILIIIEKRGVIEGIGKNAIGLAGLALGACGFPYLVYIWRADRFKVSIGRLMIVVAIIALLLQGVLVYRNWLQSR